MRRSNKKEKYCIIVKNRYGHQCQYAWIAVSLIQWDGIPADLADTAYNIIASKTTRHGTETERMCGANKKKTCACQGLDPSFQGASYTFGCSWSMYVNVCKFCRNSAVDGPRKFKLRDCDDNEETELESVCHKLSDVVTPAFSSLAPDCYNNMCLFDNVASDCRIGSQETGRPFSGITMVCDYCAHAHKDTNNMIGGCTVVVSLTKPENRCEGPHEDEQYHVLPQYVPDATQEELQESIEDGGLEVLTKFVRTISIRNTPKRAQGCKRGKPNAEKKKLLDGFIPTNWSEDSTPSTPGALKTQKKKSHQKKKSLQNPLNLQNLQRFQKKNLPRFPKKRKLQHPRNKKQNQTAST